MQQIQNLNRTNLRPTNDSWRVDETYIKVKGKDKYLYRAVDSQGNTLDFLLTAKRFFRKTLRAVHTSLLQVITVDKNPAHPKAITGLKAALATKLCGATRNKERQDYSLPRRLESGSDPRTNG